MAKLSEKAMERKKKYDKEYAKNHFKAKIMTFNIKNKDDMEMLNWLNSKSNCVQYIKQLIREDMEKSNV